jgi:AraC-like DNA-binding protein
VENIFFFSLSIVSFFIILLLSKRNKAVYDFFLIGWFTVILFHVMVFYLTTFDQYSSLLEVSSAAVFLHGPILLLYTRSLFYKRFDWKQSLHLIPFVLNIVIIAPYVFQNTLAPFSEFSRMLLAWAKLGSILIYSIWSIKIINRNLEYAEEFFSNVESHHIKWLKMAIKMVLLLWIIGFGSQVVFQVNLFELNPAHEDLFINISVSLLVIFMGYYGFRQAPVMVGTSLSGFNQKNNNEEATVITKYQRSAIDDRGLKQHADNLEALMNAEKPYRDPELSLSKLALHLNLSTNQLSQIINQYYQKNFYDFINSYRVEEVKQRIVNGDVKHTTLLGIALDAGFNSKATFNRFFKKYTGKTPSEFLKGLDSSAQV